MSIFRSAKLRALAKLKPCLARFEGCNGNPQSVVWCHLNDLSLGRGAYFKTGDLFGFFGCSQCHDLYDGRRGSLTKEEKRALGHGACLRTLHYMLENEHIKVEIA